MRVAIQGIEGSFHHEAAKKFVASDFEIIACKTFKDLFLAANKEDTDSAVVAIENTNFGSINEVYDLLEQHYGSLNITAELPLRVEQNLIASQKIPLEKIKEVHSHPVALEQCSTFLDERMPQAERVVASNTAEAVSLLSDLPKNAAAIGSLLAAEIFDMQVLEKNIENNHDNYTRFLHLSKGANDPDDKTNNKLSLTVDLAHEHGSLAKLLTGLGGLACNLTKIQSRPYINRPWEYKFYIDMVNAENTPFEKVHDCLELHSDDFKLLGAYPAVIK